MGDTLRTLTLKCTSCGSSLNVSDDMDRFACGFCGTEQVVLRRGGTVSLKPVEEAIAKVQAGTDKTAAELALSRLVVELAEVERKWQEWEQAFAHQRGGAKLGKGAVLLILLAAFLGIMSFGLLAGDDTAGAIWSGVAALGLAALVALLVRGSGQTMKRIEAERQSKWQLFYDHMESIKSQIAKQRQIVDA